MGKGEAGQQGEEGRRRGSQPPVHYRKTEMQKHKLSLSQVESLQRASSGTNTTNATNATKISGVTFCVFLFLGGGSKAVRVQGTSTPPGSQQTKHVPIETNVNTHIVEGRCKDTASRHSSRSSQAVSRSGQGAQQGDTIHI